jgi:hypothetical protein
MIKLEKSFWNYKWPTPTWTCFTCSNTMGFDGHFALYNEAVRWIKSLDNFKRNVRWIKVGDCIYIKFRREDDIMMFKLRFSEI